MRKLTLNVLLFLSAGMMLIEDIQAQQTPAASAQQAPAKAAPAPAPGAQKTPAAKTGQAAKPRTQPVLSLKTQKDKVSYALGANLGMNLHKQSVEVDTTIVLRGLKDARAAGVISCDWRHQGLDGSSATHACGIEVAAFHSLGPGLRRSRSGPALGHWPRRNPRLRSGAAFHPRKGKNRSSTEIAGQMSKFAVAGLGNSA